MTDSTDKRETLVVIFAADYAWREPGDPVLEAIDRAQLAGLVEELRREGLAAVSIFAKPSLRVPVPEGLNVAWCDDGGLEGTMGCLCRETRRRPCERVVVLHTRLLARPPVRALLERHAAEQTPATLFVEPEDGPAGGGIRPLYVCESWVFQEEPEGAYSDLKEGLLATLAGEVAVVAWPEPLGGFADAEGYRRRLLGRLEHWVGRCDGQVTRQAGAAWTLWREAQAEAAAGARFSGPVWLRRGARVEAGATVIGPAVIGAGAVVVSGAMVVRSVVGPGEVVTAGEVVDETVRGRVAEVSDGGRASCEEPVLIGDDRHDEQKAGRGTVVAPVACWRSWFVRVALLAVALAWAGASYWRQLWGRLSHSDEYSSGLLVPVLAGYILWCRRDRLRSIPLGTSWWGLLVLALGQAMRLGGLYYASMGLTDLSAWVSLVGAVWLLVGDRMMGRLATTMLFVGLMFPWPYRLQSMIAGPLQEYATRSAVFCLELMGFGVLREGNLITIGQTTVAVAEACNGLRMITAFFVIGGLVVMLAERPRWQKALVFASSLPIALICNTVRLTLTAMAFSVISGEHWEKLFHDFGGYAMMPLALALTVGELGLLDRLTTPPQAVEPEVIRRESTS